MLSNLMPTYQSFLIKKYYFFKLLLFIIGFSSYVRAQNQDIVSTNFKIDSNIQSPNSASLGIYGSVPVSLYSGTADISVPIYQINEGIPLEISLRYDASGVRVNSVPGWVGQNWSLQAGGLIERSVKGRSADEFDVTRGNNNYTELQPKFYNWGNMAHSNASNVPGFWPWWNQGYKFNIAELSKSDWLSSKNLFYIYYYSYLSNSRPLDDDPSWYSGGTNVLSLKSYQPDLEPDIFTFNFMGHTGKFFLGQDGEWKVASSSNFKVICDFSKDVVSPASTPATTFSNGFKEEYREFPRVINKITLIDDSGNQFIFGNNDATELTFPDFFNQHSLPIVSSAWYLKYAKDKFGNVIYEFEYEKGPYIGHFYLNYNKFYIVNSFNFNSVDDRFRTLGQMILPVYLKKIKTKSGLNIEMNSSIANSLKFKTNDNPFSFFDSETIDQLNHFGCQDFFYKRLPDFKTLNPEWNVSNDGLSLLKWKKLDNINIKDNNGNNLLVADFKYINQPSRRLFLTGISINKTKNYVFEYDRDDLLPNFLSSATDHLGYFNGTPFTIPSGTNWSAFYNQRLTNSETVKYGSLKKIIYPTIGSTEFIYEPHRYSKEIDKNGSLIASVSEGIIGGLRVKKIINNDGLGNNYVKEYIYTIGINSNTSSGNLLFKPLYYVSDIKTNPITTSPLKAYVYDINQLIPMVNLFGNTIEYETVIEKESYFNSVKNTINSGYNIYKYSNYSQFPNLPSMSSTVPDLAFKLPKTDKGFERGKLLEKTVYDYSNNLKEKTTYKYDGNLDLKVNAISIMMVDASVESNGAFNYDPQNERTMGGYQIYYTDKYLIEERKETFNSKGTLIKTSKYGFKNYPQIAGTIANNGDLFKTTTFEQNNIGGNLITYDYPFDDLGNPLFNSMYNSRILNPVHSKEEKIIGDLSLPDAKILISEQKTDYFEIRNNVGELIQVPQYISHKNDVGNYKTDFSFTKYDNQGNILECKTETGMIISIIWGYNKTKPIAKFENATYLEIASALGITLELLENYNENNLNLIDNLRNNTMLPNAMLTTYSYVPLFGVSTITDTRGVKTYYEYDSSGRLKFVKDKDLNILQEYCYNYKGQQGDCNGNKPTDGTQYKSIAISGSFTKNNCIAGSISSSVVYSQAVGASISTISQADADSKGLDLFNISGQANANAKGVCAFSSIARTGSFTRTNCAAGGVGSSVVYSQLAGAYTSTISQTDADSEGLKLFNRNGQVNANASGICNFSSVALSGSFERDNCESVGAVGESVVFSQAAGVETSIISQEDADSKGLARFNKNGRAYARIKANCRFSSIARSGSFVKNDCLEGEEGTLINYSQPVGAVTSTISQAAADEEGLSLFNRQGQLNANQNGTCTKFITYLPKWNAVNKTLAILAVASSSNHNGVTLRFNINYENNGSYSQTATIFIAAGQTSKGINVVLPAQYIPTVQLIAIERN